MTGDKRNQIRDFLGGGVDDSHIDHIQNQLRKQLGRRWFCRCILKKCEYPTVVKEEEKKDGTKADNVHGRDRVV